MHMLKEHKMANFNSERCLCSLCGKTLVGRSNFKKHEREKHGIDNIHRKRIIKELKLECPKCLEGFEDTMELNSHAVECEGMSKGQEISEVNFGVNNFPKKNNNKKNTYFLP